MNSIDKNCLGTFISWSFDAVTDSVLSFHTEEKGGGKASHIVDARPGEDKAS